MPGRSRIPRSLALGELLALPENAPYLQYRDGQAESNVSPRATQSLLTLRLAAHRNATAKHGEPGWIHLAPPPDASADPRMPSP